MKTEQTSQEESLQRQCEIDAHSDAHHKQHHTEEHQAKIGNCIAHLLMLRHPKGQSDRYRTAWGTKTDLGLYLSVKRIIDEERINI